MRRAMVRAAHEEEGAFCETTGEEEEEEGGGRGAGRAERPIGPTPDSANMPGWAASVAIGPRAGVCVCVCAGEGRVGRAGGRGWVARACPELFSRVDAVVFIRADPSRSSTNLRLRRAAIGSLLCPRL
jgi:hypothetical protein